MEQPLALRLFILHHPQDRKAVAALAEALAAHGLEPWFDSWSLSPDDDVVARVNAGLEAAGAGLLVLSEHTRDTRWVEAEQSYLIYARIVESKALIPVIVGDNPYVPPLLRPLARRGLEELEAIVGGLLHRRSGRPPVAMSEDSKRIPARLELRKAGATAVVAQLHLRGMAYPPLEHSRLPAALVQARDAFLRGFRSGALRTPAQAERLAIERSLQGLGAELGRFCLGEEAEAPLVELLRGAPVGTLVELSFEADTPELLGLPFEALRLRDGRLLALEPGVLVVRRSLGLAPASRVEPLAGPLKVLVAVGAPDEEHARGVPLDQEREMQSILDATALAAQRENVEVRSLEVGHPEVIGEALRRDAYHVLHLSCHGSPGSLELETEDGEACPTTAEQLLGPLRSAGRPLPLVFVNACHGGVEAAQTASLAEDLLRAGVPAVVAMQTSVTDAYATELAAAFYQELARCEPPWASAALAHARRHLEQERQRELGQGAKPPPEYATATLFLAGAEAPLVDFSRDAEPLQARPVHALAGPVPQLDLDQLIGRRKPLRQVLRALRKPEPGKVGAVLTGIGGIGKSTLAGRAMRRLAEDGWELAAHVGKIDLARLAGSVAAAVFNPSQPESLQLAQALTSNELPERLRISLLQKLLAETRLVLVLDDFEQNLTTGGEAFRDEAVAELFRELVGSARTGRLLVTCRHPIPGAEALLTRVSLGPMSHAEAGRLLQRLPGLAGRAPAELTRVLRVIGGHPRMLEYLDGLLRGGKARLPQVTERLAKALAEATPGGASQIEDLSEALVQTVQLGARDVLLGELLALAREQGTAELLLQVAVSNLPVSPAGAAQMLAGEPSDPAPAAEALQQLEALSLVSLTEQGEAWVHRWTAEGLAQLEGEEATRERANRAGRYRLWRVEHETHDLGDAIEAVRNHLAGQDWDPATGIAQACFEALTRFQQVTGIAALASEVLETLPVDHERYAVVADAEAQAYLALGWTEPALRRYQQLLEVYETRTKAEPHRADYQRDLSVAYNKIADLYVSLGQGERAQTAYQQSLDIAERLAQAEPQRADYQRDLSVSYERLGDLYRSLGQGERAQEFYLRDLAISERLAQADPQRADYQRDLSVAYERIGGMYRSLGQGEQAQSAYQQALDIRERLAQAEPRRADYQRDLSVAYERMGDLYGSLGQGERAQSAYQQVLDIREQLAQAEPQRADYQRDLSVSYLKTGDLYRSLGQGERAQEFFLKQLAIAERLAQAEPQGADYQRDLSVSYLKIGDLYRSLGQGERAQTAYQQALDIRERLARAEPQRSDYQRDLSVSYERTGDLYVSLGQSERALEACQRALAIAERLARAEPQRADYQRDLSVSYNKIGDLYAYLDQSKRALDAYQRAREIAERLAQAEPQRADYQVDLVISLFKLAQLETPPTRSLIERALFLLHDLDREGRLASADRPKLAVLSGLLEQTSPSANQQLVRAALVRQVLDPVPTRGFKRVGPGRYPAT